MKTLQRIAYSVLAAVAIALSPAFAGLAGATESTQVIQVSGTFQTQQPIPSPLCTGIEDCVVDDLTGSFNGGTNRLVTVGFTEGTNQINYHDMTRLDTNGYGIFEGDEYGHVDVNTEEFHSISISTSIDGCGSTLIIHNQGTIDLDSPNLEDIGTYEGVLIKKSC